MTELSDMLGISPGDETELRGITAPQMGETYIESFHRLLAAADKHTIYFAETQSELPAADTYPHMVGIAESTHDEIDGKTVHVTDGESWIDTYEIIEEARSDLISDLDSIETTLSLDEYDAYDSPEDLAAVVDSTRYDIFIVTLALQNSVEYKTAEELRRTISEATSALESDIESQLADTETTLETDLEDAVGSDYVQDDPINDDDSGSRRSIETDIETLQSKIADIKDCLEPADFELSNTSAPDSVAPGETVTVTADITNTGHKEGTQTVSLERQADGTELDTQSVEGLCGTIGIDDSGSFTTETANTESVSLEWEPSPSDDGRTTLIVSTDDDSVEVDLRVVGTACISLDLDITPESPLEGDDVHINGTVENSCGFTEHLQQLTLRVVKDGHSYEEVASWEIGEITGGETVTRTLEWPTSDSGAGLHTVSIETVEPDTEQSVDVTVGQTATFEIDGELSWEDQDGYGAIPEPEGGDWVDVTATIENTGDVAGTAEAVTLYHWDSGDKTEAETKSTGEIDPGADEQVTLRWHSGVNDDGAQTLRVETPDDSHEVTIEMRDPGYSRNSGSGGGSGYSYGGYGGY